MEKKFERALRKRYRFPFKGLISVEELWTLGVNDLDSVYKTLKSEQKVTNEDSLIENNSIENKELTEKIDIVKYIFEIKVDENNKAIKAREKRQKNQRIMELIKKKEDQKLEESSIEELYRLLDEDDE